MNRRRRGGRIQNSRQPTRWSLRSRNIPPTVYSGEDNEVTLTPPPEKIDRSPDIMDEVELNLQPQLEHPEANQEQEQAENASNPISISVPEPELVSLTFLAGKKSIRIDNVLDF